MRGILLSSILSYFRYICYNNCTEYTASSRRFFCAKMDNNQNHGSFGAAIGGSPALIEAMKRRGIDTSALQQVSPAAANPNPTPPPLPSDTASASAAMPQDLSQTQSQQTQPDSDVTIATKALATMVTNDSKMKRDLVNLKAQGVV